MTYRAFDPPFFEFIDKQAQETAKQNLATFAGNPAATKSATIAFSGKSHATKYNRFHSVVNGGVKSCHTASRARSDQVESPGRKELAQAQWLEHDLIAKVMSTFADHALARRAVS